jgi:hypothetical protein
MRVMAGERFAAQKPAFTSSTLIGMFLPTIF